MRVVAARFAEPDQASAALDLLRRELYVADAEVAPLGHPGEAGSDAVLAGRVPDEVAPEAVALVERAGGEIVADIDERWTGLNAASTTNFTATGGAHPSNEAYLR
jgi:hypothetical protein